MRGREIAVIVGVTLLVIVLLGLIGGSLMGPGMMGWGGYGAYPLWGVVMMISWLLILGGAVALVAWLMRKGTGINIGAPGGEPGSRALEILQERYARGELSREQYEQMRHDIQAP